MDAWAAKTVSGNTLGDALVEPIMRIGLIGSGRIGSTVASLAIAKGHDVVLSNSRRPETLADQVAIDTNNYYPQRDGQIAELDSVQTTSAELLAAHLGNARVVKAFNSIGAGDLLDQGQPAGSPDRRALPIAGDDADAKKVVTELIDSFGYDVVDAGPLAEGRRFEPNTRASGARLTADSLREALG